MSGFVRVLVLFAVLLAPAVASAQRATTGTVTGRVVDSSGAVLPGATITLQSPEALGQFSAVSDTYEVLLTYLNPYAVAPVAVIDTATGGVAHTYRIDVSAIARAKTV